MPELELGFWKASVRAREMPGARDALDLFHRLGLPMAVVSNTSFGERVIRYELEQHRLTEHLVRHGVVGVFDAKTERAAVRDGGGAIEREAEDIWFVGDRLDTDVAGAKAAGRRWRTPHDRTNRSVERRRSRCDELERFRRSGFPPAFKPTARYDSWLSTSRWLSSVAKAALPLPIWMMKKPCLVARTSFC